MDTVTKVHPKFSAQDADILVLSSDDVLFRLHSANIRAHSTVFPIHTLSCEPARKFSEESTILEILFAHLYPTRPNLEDLEVGVVQTVGYAAYKYGIASAMINADSKMLEWAQKYPTEVASYALLHFKAGPRLDRAMKCSINIPLETAMTRFSPKDFVAWLLLRERWFNRLYGTKQFSSVQSYALSADQAGVNSVAAPISYSECVRDVAALDIAFLP